VGNARAVELIANTFSGKKKRFANGALKELESVPLRMKVGLSRHASVGAIGAEYRILKKATQDEGLTKDAESHHPITTNPRFDTQRSVLS
jgi:hypothetical protein